MSFLVRLSFLTCGLYLGFALLLLLALMILGRVTSGIGIMASRWGWMVVFGVIWAAAFNLAWGLVMPKLK